MTFHDVIVECAMTPELVKQFNRLTGCSLDFRDRRTPIERMVDQATGNPFSFSVKREEVHKFIAFVFECIWLPLVCQEIKERGEHDESQV